MNWERIPKLGYNIVDEDILSYNISSTLHDREPDLQYLQFSQP